MTVHRLKLKDLDKQSLKRLQEQYADAEVEIHLSILDETVMNEETFWKMITLLDWGKVGNDDAVIEPLIQELSSLEEEKILAFYDLLSEKLYLLDGKAFAQNSTLNESVSSDLFLYARCCVVANGKESFERILKTPSEFPNDLFFEALLHIPEKAWFRKTGKSLKHVPKYVFETGFNPNGWGAKTISL